MKIYDQNQSNAVIYDNNLGQPDTNDSTTVPAGGNIVIHE